MWRVTFGDYRQGRLDSVVYAPVPGFPKPLTQSWSWGWDGNSGVYDVEVAPDHPAAGAVSLCDPDSWCEVYNTAESYDFPVWRGYFVEQPDSFGDGTHGELKMSFAGELGQLSQVTAPRYDTTFEETGMGSPEEQFVRLVLAEYNRYTEEGRRILMGRVDTWHLGSLELSDDGTSSTCLDVITKHFVDDMGGYVYMSYDADGAKLNCVSSIERRCAQQVRFGVNELGFERTESALSLASGVKPIGAKLSDTPYAGRYFLAFEPSPSKPADWDEAYGDYYTATAFEPLTSEPDGWNLSERDAREGGMKWWNDYWYYDEENRKFVLMSSAESKIHERPAFLSTGSNGRVCFWDAKVEDPYALQSLSEVTSKVSGMGYTRLDDKPEGFPEGCYVPTVEDVTVPYQSELGKVTWERGSLLAWNSAKAEYVPMKSRPAQWLWDSGDNYSSHYERTDPIYDAVHRGYVVTYKAVAKRHRLLSRQPSDWADEYSSYKLKSGDSYTSVPRYTKAGQNITGWSERKWREGYSDMYRRTFDNRTGVEDFTRYAGRWMPVQANTQAYRPSDGKYVPVNASTWNSLRSNLWYGTSAAAGEEGAWNGQKGQSSCSSTDWGSGWHMGGGVLHKSGSSNGQLWYKLPPANRGECYLQEAPRWGVYQVYEEYVPEWVAGEFYTAVEPEWQPPDPLDPAKGYWAKRTEDTAPGGYDDPRQAVWPGDGPWASEPVYSSTGKADQPLTMGLVTDADEQEHLIVQAESEARATGFSWDGDVLWHDGAVERYGKRSAPLDAKDATEYVPLLSFAMTRLDEMRLPSLEVQMKAVDLSAGDGSEPMLPGKLVDVVDAPHGMGTPSAPAQLPCVAVSQLDFADPESGRVELGAAQGGIAGAARAVTSYESAAGGMKYALSSDARRAFAAGVREVVDNG